MKRRSPRTNSLDYCEPLSLSQRIQFPSKPRPGELCYWRCTRNRQGIKVHPLNRPGYYVLGRSYDEVVAKMWEKFPEDKFYGFTAQQWRPLTVTEVKRLVKENKV